LEAIRGRFLQCGLELNANKTRIVYCKDDDRPGKSGSVKFDFLGYSALQECTDMEVMMT
jgi:hypothetical protein